MVFNRPLGDEGAGSISLAEGVAIPLAVFAWDGSSAETSARGSVSSWMYLYQEEPVSSAVWIVPLAAVLLTAAVLLLLVSSARRRATVAATPV